MNLYRYRIIHPTDLSEAGGPGFAHALRLATLLKADLRILHVRRRGEDATHSNGFPAVRHTLSQWGLIPDSARREDIERQIGVHIAKMDILDHSAADGIRHYVEHEGASLLVMETHGRDGFDRMVHGSVAEDIAAALEVPVLFVPLHSNGFVSASTGNVAIRRIVVPVARQPHPQPAIEIFMAMARDLRLRLDRIEFIHIGADAPDIRISGGVRAPVRQVEGAVIDAILSAADDAQLIVMPTARRDSLLDMLRGTTTERVVRHARCPVLAIPT